MGKLIYRGFNPNGDLISSQPFAITGANLRKSSDGKLERQKKTAKTQAGKQPVSPQSKNEKVP